jgi:hypothetical protein
MELKRNPSHEVYIAALRRLTPEQRLAKAFAMSAFVRALFRQGLRERFPDLPPAEFEALLRQRLELCHNRSW